MVEEKSNLKFDHCDYEYCYYKEMEDESKDYCTEQQAWAHAEDLGSPLFVEWLDEDKECEVI